MQLYIDISKTEGEDHHFGWSQCLFKTVFHIFRHKFVCVCVCECVSMHSSCRLGISCIQHKCDVTRTGDRQYIRYQKVTEPPTVTEVFWCICWITLIHRDKKNENRRAPNSTLRMRWRLPCLFVNTPNRLQMEGGRVALWREVGRVAVMRVYRRRREEGDSVEWMDIATSALSCQQLQ